MMGTFNSYLDRIDINAWRDICVNMGELRHVTKGEEFVIAGCVGKYVGHIVKGTLKYVAYSSDGAEHVMGLVGSDEFVADWPFALYGEPARMSIVATSDSEIYCINVKTIGRLLNTDHQFRDIVMHATEAVYSTIYDRYMDLYCKTPQQRYVELYSHFPDLFDSFTLKDIASFLHITPTHLSRLRKQDKK